MCSAGAHVLCWGSCALLGLMCSAGAPMAKPLHVKCLWFVCIISMSSWSVDINFYVLLLCLFYKRKKWRFGKKKEIILPGTILV